MEIQKIKKIFFEGWKKKCECGNYFNHCVYNICKECYCKKEAILQEQTGKYGEVRLITVNRSLRGEEC